MSYQSVAAAEWRLRVQKRNNIFAELNKIGSIPSLMCGSLLILPVEGKVESLVSYSRWRETFEQSPMYNRLDIVRQKHFANMEYPVYSRLEDGINCLGRILALCCEEQDDPFWLEACSELKVWGVTTSLQYRSADQVLTYLKWAAKAAQAAFLNAAIPDLPAVRPGKFLGCVLPFAGPLKFISELILGRRDRSKGIALEEGRALAQFASLSRALPYPSSRQVRESVEDTHKLTQSAAPRIKQGTKLAYKASLRLVKNRIGTNVSVPKDTHVSLAGSGSLESTRVDGGRGGDLVRLAKPVCNLKVTEEILSVMEGKRDVFGFIPISNLMAESIRRRKTLDPERDIRLGHFLYRMAADLQEIWETSDDTSRPPRELAKIFNLVCSADLLTWGYYTKPNKEFKGMLLFEEEGLSEFIPTVNALPVRADVSIEAGMKTRLTTAASTAYVHFGQQIGHVLRTYLRHDPFLQVGFEEPDKLWSVLSQYRHQLFKTDLKKV